MEQVLAGRYALEAEIDRGAIGTVWRARDLTTGEPVAVKVLLPETAHDADVVQSLLDEAEILAQLNHPSIVRPRDFVANGLRALVMDLVDGVDVRKRLRSGGPLRPAEVAEIGAQIADALASVHAAGILHGDVKPGNIMVPAGGGPAKLVDFGVARRIQLPDTVTHATPEYVAPEVVIGDKPTPASDVYSLGMVLYEMTCGRSPYRGGSVGEVIERHGSCVPVQPAGMPDELWSLVFPCVEIEPGDRPRASEVAGELRRLAPRLVGRPAAATLPEYASTYRPRLVDPVEAAAPASPAAAGAVMAGPPGPVSAVPMSGGPLAGVPVSAGPLVGDPGSSAPGTTRAGAGPEPAAAREPGEGSVLSLFGTPRDEPTQVVGGAPVPPERPRGRGGMVAFVGAAAALLVLLALGAGFLIWSSTGGSEPVAKKDPAPTGTPAKPEPTSSAKPSPSGSPSPTPTESPERPQPEPPADRGDGSGDGADRDGDSGGDSDGDSGGDGGRPGLGDPMPTMPRG